MQNMGEIDGGGAESAMDIADYSARKDFVGNALKMVEKMKSLLVLSKGRSQHDLKARLSAIEKELKSANYLNPDTDGLLIRFSLLLAEIHRELNLRAERKD
jgi:hypothetical protein